LKKERLFPTRNVSVTSSTLAYGSQEEHTTCDHFKFKTG